MEDVNSFLRSWETVRILGVLAISTVKCYTLGQKKKEAIGLLQERRDARTAHKTQKKCKQNFRLKIEELKENITKFRRL